MKFKLTCKAAKVNDGENGQANGYKLRTTNNYYRLLSVKISIKVTSKNVTKGTQ